MATKKPSQMLKELGIELPAATAAVANYLPFMRTGNMVYTAGQLPKTAAGLAVGKVGENVTIEQAKEAAKVCAINIIAQIQAAAGKEGIDAVERIVKVNVFVNATGDFKNHPQVADGASDLFVAVFGEKGRHARAAVGVGSLPLGVPVEIDAVVELAADASSSSSRL